VRAWHRSSSVGEVNVTRAGGVIAVTPVWQDRLS
jgi:hypothetical protein